MKPFVEILWPRHILRGQLEREESFAWDGRNTGRRRKGAQTQRQRQKAQRGGRGTVDRRAGHGGADAKRFGIVHLSGGTCVGKQRHEPVALSV